MKNKGISFLLGLNLIIISIIFCNIKFINMGVNNDNKKDGRKIIYNSTIDGIDISIIADKGVFPNDVIATVEKIDNESDIKKVENAIISKDKLSEKNIKNIYSYNITVRDKKGKELQPDISKGEVFVVFKNINEIDKSHKDNFQVWHIKDSLDSAEKIDNSLLVADNEIKTGVEHFSIYSIIINEDEEKSIKYFKGESDKTSYFIIEDAEDMCLFRDIVNGTDVENIQIEYVNEDKNIVKNSSNSFNDFAKNARVVKDIDMSQIKDWIPIGTDSNKYDGIFESVYKGVEYNINNLSVNAAFSEIKAAGLFGYVDESKAKIYAKVDSTIYRIPDDNEISRFLEGAGTAKSPYLIKTAEDFKYMRDVINNGISGSGDGVINGTEGSVKGISACYKLDDSIGDEGLDLGEDWQAICSIKGIGTLTENNSFNGVIDGNYKKIKYSSNNEGLFGTIFSNAVIKKLIIEGNIINDNKENYIGVIVGFNLGKISDCTVKGEISATDSNYTFQYVGGVVGKNSNMGKLDNIQSLVDITCENLPNAHMGGMIGYNVGKLSYSYCNTNMDIKDSKRGYGYVGGLIGCNYGEVFNTFANVECKTNGNVNSYEIGGAIGENRSEANVYNIWISGEILGSINSQYYSQLGGLIGYNTGYQERGITDNCYSVINLACNINRVRKGSVVGELGYGITRYCYGENGNGLIGTYNSVNGTWIEENNSFIPVDMLEFVNLLNARSQSQGYSLWTVSPNINDGYPIIQDQTESIKPECEIIDGDKINIYGNGCKLIIKEENNKTVIYYINDDNKEELLKEIDIDNTLPVNVYGGFKEDCGVEYDRESHITMLGGKVANIYGGSYNCDLMSSSNIIIKGGIVDNIYGSGMLDNAVYSAKVLCGITIDIQGGTVGYVDANGHDLSSSNTGDVSTEGNKIIKVSGAPIIGHKDNNSGINIDAFTNKKVLVDSSVSCAKDSITIKTTNINSKRRIATLSDENYVDANVFYIDGVSNIDNKTLYKYVTSNRTDIVIADTVDAILSPESTNVIGDKFSAVGYGFGTNVVAKDYKWVGKLITPNNYYLPRTISVKINGVEAVQGTDYSYNLYNGEIIVYKGKTVGNIEVTANAIYIQPTIYIDKPSISNDNLVYTGKPQRPNIINSVDDLNGDKYSVEIKDETNAGEYIVKVSLKNKMYTKWKDNTSDDIELKWRINKADLYIKANDKNVTYGDEESNAGVSYEGFVNGEDKSVLKGKLAFLYDYKKYADVGLYVITPRGYESDNYNMIYKPGTLEVFPKKVSFKWLNKTLFIYDGNTKEITALTGTKSNNYTLVGASNISKKWNIIKEDKVDDKEAIDKDSTNNDAVDKNTTNKNESNKDETNKNDSSTNVSNNGNKNETSSGLTDRDNIDSNVSIEGAIEGVRVSDEEIRVEIDENTIITAQGSFSDTIRLMVKVIKKTRKEWNWIKNITKNIGENRSAYDIFFVDKKGKRVDIEEGTRISIMSREKMHNVEVYYINNSKKKIKIKSKKEDYVIKFKMIKNGYYALLIEAGNNKEDSVLDDKDSKKDKDEESDNADIKDNIDENENIDNKDAGQENDTQKKDTIDKKIINDTIANKDKEENKKVNSLSWIIIMLIVLIIVSLIMFIIFWKKNKKDKENE